MEDIKINMTNQEAIKALQEFALNYGLSDKMIDAFGKAIRALEDQPEWISVDDRLPANANSTEKEYLVQFPNNTMTVLNYYDGWNCFVDRYGVWHNSDEIKNIIFWMELPKPKVVDGDDMAIKALEQESVLDKIRAEIEKTMNSSPYFDDVFEYKYAFNEVLAIIDKYKAESEVQDADSD